MTDSDTNSDTNDDYGTKGLRNASLVVLALVVFTPVRSYALPLVVIIAALAAIGYFFRRVFRFNRNLGFAVTGLLSSAIGGYSILLYNNEQAHQELLASLAEYSDVTVRRNVFPLPYVHQLSIGRGVDDDEFTDILALDGLDRVSDLYLDNNVLTDQCLRSVVTIPDLSYVFIDCDNITDDAILDLERQLPDCRVIPYQRFLHGEPNVFLGMPPNDG